MPKTPTAKTQPASLRYPLRNKNVKIFIPNFTQLKIVKPVSTKRKIIKKAPKRIVPQLIQPHCAPMAKQVKKSTPNKAHRSKIKIAIHNKKNNKSNSKHKTSHSTGMRMSIRIKQKQAIQKLKRLGIGQQIRIRSQSKRSQSTQKKESQLIKGQSANKRSKSAPKLIPLSNKQAKNKLKDKTKKKTKKLSRSIRPPSHPKIKMESPKVYILPPPLPRRTAAINHHYIQDSASNNLVPTDHIQQQSSKGEARLKSIAELQRINRSRQQRIFLLSAERIQNSEWTFRIIGTKGQIYTTRIFTVAKCTCFDFRSQRKPCKHIYFIVTQIAQNQKILEGFNSKGSISQTAFEELNECLCKRLKARIAGVKPDEEGKEIDLKDDKDCVICFTEMDQKEEVLEVCSTCKKYFHNQCIKQWRTHNNTCPLCRSEFESPKLETDPLQKFEELKI